MTRDYRQFSDDEQYLFHVVTPRFERQRWLNAFDMMTIARWKAERARVRFARRLVSRGARTLDEGARSLSSALARARTDGARFQIAIGDWGFPLPTGSAILTVCFPSAFTVYDVRVCDELKAFHSLKNRTRTASVWDGYQAFKNAVISAAPSGLSLRDCDRWLWGRSRCEELTALLSSFARSRHRRGDA